MLNLESAGQSLVIALSEAISVAEVDISVSYEEIRDTTQHRKLVATTSSGVTKKVIIEGPRKYAKNEQYYIQAITVANPDTISHGFSLWVREKNIYSPTSFTDTLLIRQAIAPGQTLRLTDTVTVTPPLGGGGGGVGDAYSLITDGSTTAMASGPDTIRFVAGAGISVEVVSDHATYGDAVIITNTGGGGTGCLPSGTQASYLMYNGTAWEAVLEAHEVHTLLAGLSSIPLNETPMTGGHIRVWANGILQTEGIGNDYQVAGSVVNFNYLFDLDARISVEYEYSAGLAPGGDCLPAGDQGDCLVYDNGSWVSGKVEREVFDSLNGMASVALSSPILLGTSPDVYLNGQLLAETHDYEIVGQVLNFYTIFTTETRVLVKYKHL